MKKYDRIFVIHRTQRNCSNEILESEKKKSIRLWRHCSLSWAEIDGCVPVGKVEDLLACSVVLCYEETLTMHRELRKQQTNIRWIQSQRCDSSRPESMASWEYMLTTWLLRSGTSWPLAAPPLGVSAVRTRPNFDSAFIPLLHLVYSFFFS